MLSYDVTSVSVIKPCIKIGNVLMTIYPNCVVTSLTTSLLLMAENPITKFVSLKSYDKWNLHSCSGIIELINSLRKSLASYLFLNSFDKYNNT